MCVSSFIFVYMLLLYLNAGESRYVESNRTPSGWHSGPTSSKSFNSVTSSGSRDPRNEPSSWSSRSSDGVNRYFIFQHIIFNIAEFFFIQYRSISSIKSIIKIRVRDALVADGATRVAWEIHCGIRFHRRIKADRCNPWD